MCFYGEVSMKMTRECAREQQVLFTSGAVEQEFSASAVAARKKPENETT
jgi:hypothetical protein